MKIKFNSMLRILRIVICSSLMFLCPILATYGSTNSELLIAGDKLLSEFKMSDAESKYKEAIRVSETLVDKSGMAIGLDKLGNLASEIGDYGSAVLYYRQAYNLFSDLQQKDGQITELLGIGAAYENWGDLPGAIYAYNEAMNVSPSSSARILVDLRLGFAFLTLGDDDRSQEHFNSVWNSRYSVSELKQRAAILLQLGEAFLKTGALNQAKAAFHELSGMKGQGDTTNSSLIGLGNICVALGKTSEAEIYYRKAGYSIGLGRLSLFAGRYEEACTYFRQSLAESERQNDAGKIFAARAGIGLARVAQQQNSEAEEYLRRAVEALEELRDLLPMGKRLYFLSGTTHGFVHLSIYESLAIALVAEGKNEEAFKIAEHTRSRILTEALMNKTSLIADSGEALSHQSTAATSGAKSDGSQDTARKAVETVPFSFLANELGQVSSDANSAAVFSLLITAVFRDFDKGEAKEAISSRTGHMLKAGFNSRIEELVIKKLEDIKRMGVNNHLTSHIDNMANN